MGSDIVSLAAAPKKKRAQKLKTIIGWREWASLPEFGAHEVNAKIDTGAKTSAIHAFRIVEKKIDGVMHVEFYLHPLQRRRHPEIFCRAPIADRRLVRSSNGQEQLRPVIRTRLRLGVRSWLIDLTLTNRDAMGFRMLIGRDALRRRFLVDPGASYLLGRGSSEGRPL